MSVGRRFGTDGIRGVANADLTAEDALGLGRAVASAMLRPGDRLLVGRDSRRSGEMLVAALGAGATSMGIDVAHAGILPTPALAWAVGELGFGAGIDDGALARLFAVDKVAVGLEGADDDELARLFGGDLRHVERDGDGGAELGVGALGERRHKLQLGQRLAELEALWCWFLLWAGCCRRSQEQKQKNNA